MSNPKTKQKRTTQTKSEIATPPSEDVRWRCSRKNPGFAEDGFVVLARTAFAAGQIAGQHFDCHWSALDVEMLP